MTPVHISSKEAEKDFAHLLNSVYRTKVPVIIKEEEKDLPIGVLISPEQYDAIHEQYEAIQKAELRLLWSAVDEIRANTENEDPEELEQLITEIVEEVRQEFYDKQQTVKVRDFLSVLPSLP